MRVKPLARPAAALEVVFCGCCSGPSFSLPSFSSSCLHGIWRCFHSPCFQHSWKSLDKVHSGKWTAVPQARRRRVPWERPGLCCRAKQGHVSQTLRGQWTARSSRHPAWLESNSDQKQRASSEPPHSHPPNKPKPEKLPEILPVDPSLCKTKHRRPRIRKYNSAPWIRERVSWPSPAAAAPAASCRPATSWLWTQSARQTAHGSRCWPCCCDKLRRRRNASPNPITPNPFLCSSFCTPPPGPKELFLPDPQKQRQKFQIPTFSENTKQQQPNTHW